MLNPEEMICRVNGFVVFFISASCGFISASVFGWLTVSGFLSSVFTGTLISCFSLRKGANIINFFF